MPQNRTHNLLRELPRALRRRPGWAVAVAVGAWALVALACGLSPATYESTARFLAEPAADLPALRAEVTSEPVLAGAMMRLGGKAPPPAPSPVEAADGPGRWALAAREAMDARAAAIGAFARRRRGDLARLAERLRLAPDPTAPGAFEMAVRARESEALRRSTRRLGEAIADAWLDERRARSVARRVAHPAAASAVQLDRARRRLSDHLNAAAELLAAEPPTEALGQARRALGELDGRLDAARELGKLIEEQLASPPGQDPVVPEALLERRPVLRRLEGRLAEVLVELNRLQTLHPAHPGELRRRVAEIAAVREQLAEQLRRHRRRLVEHAEMLSARRSAAAERLERLRRRAAARLLAEQERKRLQEDVGAARTAAGTWAQAPPERARRTIRLLRGPGEPRVVAPRLWVWLAAGLVPALLAGGLAAVAADRLFPRREADGLTAGGLPVLARLGRMAPPIVRREGAGQ